MKETSKLTEEAYSEVTEGTDVTDYRESTITAKEDLTLTSSYERSVKNTIDLKKKSEASVKGKLFKILDVSLKSNTSVGFNSVMEQISKSSSAFNRSLVNEAVTRLTTKSTYESIERRKLTQELTKDRAISNSTSEPMQYIIRDSYCVNSVIHKRTNAQLAWSDCIENPGKDLCRPNNIEESLSEEIKEIHDKWSTAPPPASLGPKPEDEKVCTTTLTLSGGFGWGSTEVLTGTVNGNIPPDSSYIGGSALIKRIDSGTRVEYQQLISQPSTGATGSVQFAVQFTVENKTWEDEWVKYQICFKVTSPESAEYYANLEQWRNDQAEAEIEILLTEQKEKLNEFLLSDKVASAIEKRIFQDFFGLTAINNCCELIYHIRSIFDFDKLCFSYQPSWDASGTGCQSSDPVSIYTALCLKFFLPVKEGKEWQAVTTLLAINAIPHAALHQVGGYINSINDLRDTEFNSTFDTAGWDEKIDAPNQYNLTPYGTSNNGWDTDFESKLNFQLINAYTVTVPTGGVKIDLRPVLCEG